MMERRVEVAVPAPFWHPLDYLAAEHEIAPGQRVVVPLGQRRVVGIALSAPKSVAPDGLECRPVDAVLDTAASIPESVLRLCSWASGYYHQPLGLVLAAALPASLRRPRVTARRRASPKPRSPATVPPAAPPELTDEQQAILDGWRAEPAGFAVHLLEGVTGSGKTEVYLQRIADRLGESGQALVLTPEIGLTPQLVDRLRRRFGDAVAVYHSGLTERERRDAWLAAARGDARILVGTRSAVLVPLPRLALVVVDEEHDASFKQQEGFRYSARDLAIVRAQQASVPVILGSATPSLETLHGALQGRYRHWRMERRVASRPLPSVRLLDLRGAALRDGLSEPMLDAIGRHTAAGNQALIFVNRRGYAPALICHDCGWTAGCSACDARMTLHRSRNRLICHHCGNASPIPLRCPGCGGLSLQPVGQGTERLEAALERHFPGLPVERIDSDRMARAGELERVLDEIAQGRAAILVGTQMLAKGHDFPALTLVGVIDADAALFSADFRATERMGQLLTQVAGRAGRGQTPGEVLIQTHQPTHPALQQWLQAGYRGLSLGLIEERRLTGLPPHGYLALIRAEAMDAEPATRFLQAVADSLAGSALEVMGPVPAPMERRAGRYRFQLLLRSVHRPRLQATLAARVPGWAEIQGARRVRWSVDVDPIDLY